MSAVTGPISTLPGAIYPAPEGVRCDHHSHRPAAGRLQGETDSMGSEMHDLCHECLDKARAAFKPYASGFCDWCLARADDLRNRRDWEEGTSGRIYRVCGACVKREAKRLAEMYEDDWR
jgi:hypothetical protein